MKTRLVLTSVAIVAVGLAALWSLRSCGELPTSQPGHSARAATAPPREERGQPRRPSASGVSSESQQPGSPHVELRLVDIGTHAPTGRVALRIRNAEEAGAPDATVETSDAGVAAFERSGRFRVTIDATGLQLVFPENVYGESADVLVCRWARVSCDVAIEPAPESRPPVRVIAAPTDRVGGEWMPDPKRIGSSTWLRAEAPRLATASATSTENPIALDLPVFSEVTFAAVADGYLPDVTSARLSSTDAEGKVVHLSLRKARRVAVEVTDENGSPVEGATFQYAVHRRGTRGEVNPAIQLLLRDVDGAAVTMRSSPKDDWSELERIVQETTDVNGSAGVDEPLAGTTEILAVWAEGYRPYLVRRSTDASSDVTRVRLERFARTCDAYRLVRGGSVLKSVSLVLAEKLEGNFTPSLPTITSDREGRITSGFIVPGRTYVATVIDHASRTNYVGDLTFGSTSEVSADGLRGSGSR